MISTVVKIDAYHEFALTHLGLLLEVRCVSYDNTVIIRRSHGATEVRRR